MVEQNKETNKENNSPTAVDINYRKRQMDFIHISPTEINYLTDTSSPFQVCLALSTTFLGAGLGIAITFSTTENSNQSLKGYTAICFLVALGFGYIAYTLHRNIRKTKEEIINKNEK